MKVGEVCNREVVVVEMHESIRDAAKLMREYHVGDVVVVENKEDGCIPVGILTDRDIVVELIAENVDMDSVSAGDVMSPELVTVREDDDIMTMIKIMRGKVIRRIPVVNRDGGLEGIISVDDLVELLTEQLNDLADIVAKQPQREKEERS